MKKTVLLLTLISFSTLLQAQGFGIQLGYNMAKLSLSERLEKFEHLNSISGFNIGFNYDIEIAENLYLEPGLIYTAKGGELLTEEEGYNGKDFIETNKFNYLEVPILGKYTFEVGDEMYLFGKFGLSFGFALSGKYIRDNGKDVEEEDWKFGSNSDELNAFDTGLNIGAGVMFNNLEVGINYNSGQSNILNSKKNKWYNKVFSINFGYRFNN